MRGSLMRGIGDDPYTDWALILSGACVIGIILIIMGVYTYINVDNTLRNPSKVSEQPAQTTAVDTRGLSKVLTEFRDRSNLREALSKGYNGVGDPSF